MIERVVGMSVEARPLPALRLAPAFARLSSRELVRHFATRSNDHFFPVPDAEETSGLRAHAVRDVEEQRTDRTGRRSSVQWPVLLAYVAVPVVLGALIGLVTDSGPWYDQLDKSPLNPPGPVFGIVWSVLRPNVKVSTSVNS